MRAAATRERQQRGGQVPKSTAVRDSKREVRVRDYSRMNIERIL